MTPSISLYGFFCKNNLETLSKMNCNTSLSPDNQQYKINRKEILGMNNTLVCNVGEWPLLLHIDLGEQHMLIKVLKFYLKGTGAMKAE